MQSFGGDSAGYSIESDIDEVIRKFRSTFPDLTRQQIVEAMVYMTDKLETGVRSNIAKFNHERDEWHGSQRQEVAHLADALESLVTVEGSTVIGSVFIDLEMAPHARLLEMGGTVRATDIRPRSPSGSLEIPVQTLTSHNPEEGHMGATLTERGEFIYPHGTPERGPVEVRAFRYMQTALADLAREFDNDLERALAIVASIL